jgi:hypothetical protein
LNRVNNALGNVTAVDGSRGIEFVNSTFNVHPTALTITAASGANSNNKIYSNTIQNCNIGISIIGFAATSPFTNSDQNNDVGGISAATGNTIINFGGGGTNPSAAIRTLAQQNFNASFNIVNNNNGAGVSHTGTLRGIYVNTATSANSSINNNTLTLNFGGTTSQVSVIENASGATAANNTVSIQNNWIINSSNLAGSTNSFFGIHNNSASCAHLNISNNTFTNNVSSGTSGITYLIYNTGAVASSISIVNNKLAYSFNSASAHTSSHYGIYNISGTTATTLNVSSNVFSNYNHTSVGTGALYFVYNTFGMSSATYSANSWNNLTLNHSGAQYYLYNGSSTQNQLAVLNNTITNINRTGAAGSFYGYYSLSSALPVCVQTFSGNIFSNITGSVAGTGVFYAFYNTDGSTSPYPRKLIHNNIVSNVNYNSTGTMYGFYTNYLGDASGNSGSQIYNNLIDNMTNSGTHAAFYMGSLSSPSYAVSVLTNTITNITTNGSGSLIYGSQILSGTGGINFFRNKISGVTANGTTGSSFGLWTSTSPTTTIYNNLVGNILSPNSTGITSANGIFVSAGTNVNLFYNTVYLGGTSTGVNFGSNAVYSSTVSNLTMRNNIFANLATATGTGAAVAYRRMGNSLTNYNTSSNNNLFYAGAPGSMNLIYSDGVNNYQALSTYISAVSPADGNSVTENPTFQSLSGASANF